VQTVSDIRAERIREFLVFRREAHILYTGHPFKQKSNKKGCSPRTIQAAYASLSAFFNWAIQESLIQTNPCANIKRPKLEKRLVVIFSRDEVADMLKVCDDHEDDAIGARNKAILLTLLDTAVRVSELVGMRMDRLNLSEGSARVTGKGAKERDVPIGVITRKALWRYISLFRPEPLGGKSADTMLFLNQDGSALTGRMAEHIVSRVAKKAGLSHAHPHQFRHTAAVQFLRNGGNVFALQKMLGHTTLEMVRYYVELSKQDVKDAHKTASPADNWQLR
jgi:site-specific recombinase XerD